MELDGSALARGAGLALAISVPAILAHEVIDAVVGIGAESNAGFFFYVVIVAGMVLGGRLAGRRRPDAPLTHGALAALAAYAVLAGASSVIHVANGDGVDAIALIFNALMATSAGILGGLVASTGRARPAA